MSKWLGRIEEIIVVLSLAIMSVIAFLYVITRNIFDLTLAFTEEITISLFVFLTFLGSAIGLRKGAHLGFSLLLDPVSPSFRLDLTMLIAFILVIFIMFFAYYVVEMMIYQFDIDAKTPALGWPKWLFSLSIPLGSLLCAIRTIEVTVRELKGTSREQGGAA